MFPINANDPYIKETGERSTMGSVIGSGGGGGSDLPNYGVGDAGKVLGVNDTGNLEWTEQQKLPTYSIADAGKVLSINDSGSLEWVTVTSNPNRYADVNAVSDKSRETTIEEV